LQDLKRPLLRVASDGIKDDIHSSQRLLESILFVVHNSFSTQASDVVEIDRGCGRDHMKARELRQLYGVRTDVARGSMDEYGLPSSYTGVVEKHLPGRDGYNWG